MNKHRYEVIIYWSDEDKSFIAEAPELPGCVADGASHGEALSNLELTIHDWIETAKSLGRTVPEPKGRLLFA
jgi:predicted RNase H-like HicB family nuclease